MLNLPYAGAGRAKNAKNAKGMPFSMYGDFYLTTLLPEASMTLSFKYSA